MRPMLVLVTVLAWVFSQPFATLVSAQENTCNWPDMYWIAEAEAAKVYPEADFSYDFVEVIPCTLAYGTVRIAQKPVPENQEIEILPGQITAQTLNVLHQLKLLVLFWNTPNGIVQSQVISDVYPAKLVDVQAQLGIDAAEFYFVQAAPSRQLTKLTMNERGEVMMTNLNDETELPDWQSLYQADACGWPSEYELLSHFGETVDVPADVEYIFVSGGVDPLWENVNGTCQVGFTTIWMQGPVVITGNEWSYKFKEAYTYYVYNIGQGYIVSNGFNEPMLSGSTYLRSDIIGTNLEITTWSQDGEVHDMIVDGITRDVSGSFYHQWKSLVETAQLYDLIPEEGHHKPGYVDTILAHPFEFGDVPGSPPEDSDAWDAFQRDTVFTFGEGWRCASDTCQLTVERWYNHFKQNTFMVTATLNTDGRWETVVTEQDS